MFYIKNKLTNKIHPWMNNHEDDFLQFVPEQLDVAKEDLEIYKCSRLIDLSTLPQDKIIITSIDIPNLKIEYKEKTAGFFAEEEGQTEDSVDLAFNIVGTETLTQISWPYEQDGSFLGNN